MLYTKLCETVIKSHLHININNYKRYIVKVLRKSYNNHLHVQC